LFFSAELSSFSAELLSFSVESLDFSSVFADALSKMCGMFASVVKNSRASSEDLRRIPKDSEEVGSSKGEDEAWGAWRGGLGDTDPGTRGDDVPLGAAVFQSSLNRGNSFSERFLDRAEGEIELD
jgi:hypothetical protein